MFKYEQETYVSQRINPVDSRGVGHFTLKRERKIVLFKGMIGQITIPLPPVRERREIDLRHSPHHRH